MKPLASAKSTPSASESSESTGQMSLFGETCEISRVPTLLPTPVAYDATPGGPNNHYNGLGKQANHGLLPIPTGLVMDTPFNPDNPRGVYQAYPIAAAVQAYPSSPPATPVSHSLSPGSDWARKMTATYGRKFADYWLSCDPPDSWVRTLLGTSTWGSMTCYLTWKRSATQQGRLLFRLVPSTPRTGGIGSGLWGTPTSRDHKDTGNMENVPVNGLLGRQVLMPTPRTEGFDAGKHRGKPDSLHSYAKMWPTPRAGEAEHPGRANVNHKGQTGLAEAMGAGKLNSAWVSRMMGYPDGWLTLDGEEAR